MKEMDRGERKRKQRGKGRKEKESSLGNSSHKRGACNTEFVETSYLLAL